jgi:protoporphyrinogen IX oxidase
MTIGGLLTVSFGIAMIVASPAYLAMGWLHAKLTLVALLVIYHIACYRFVRRFARGQNTRSARWFRRFNEIPSLLLIGIVILVIVKPF